MNNIFVDYSFMRKSTILFFFIHYALLVSAQRVVGTITDKDGNPLSFASVSIKNSVKGTNANSAGKYSLQVGSGKFTIVCQHVGYQKEEKTITVSGADVTVDFVLDVQAVTMGEVVVTRNDPAYEIIRKAIAKRKYYQAQLDHFQCEVYTKGQLKVRNYPNKIFGQKVDFEDADTSKQKMIYLSETVSIYSVDKPANEKIEVVSSKVSGRSDGYGLAAPQFFSFYDNNILIGDRNNRLNPRGFISPLSDNAINYYRYRYQGAFIEDGRLINKIKIIPRRKYEPVFSSGYINIVENDWRIHSLQLELTKQSQMEFVDTLRIEQLYRPLNDSIWVISSQVIYPAIKILGFDAYGSFINIYSKFDADPQFGKKLFNTTILKYTDSANKKTADYWEATRPVPLQDEEVHDYRRKDSLEKIRKDPRYIDSMQRIHNKVTMMNAMVFGQTISDDRRKTTFNIRPLTEQFSFNPVEGLVINTGATWTKRLDSTGFSRRSVTVAPNLRYGFSNQHINGHLTVRYNFGSGYSSSIMLSGGSRIFQYNNQSPIGPRTSSLTTLISKNNRYKIYEALYLRGSFNKGIGHGFSWTVAFQYQDRIPLENTTEFSFGKKDKNYSPNYPVELMSSNFLRHQVLMVLFGLRWQPNSRYIELADQKINIGSKWPVFTAEYVQGIDKIFGSDEDFSKWKITMAHDLNFRLRGQLRYRLGIGGFIDSSKVQVPDYQHFNGNTSVFATEYLNSFQLLPIYKYSNKEKFYSLAHLEYHLNGFLTNKIPGFRRLNWYLVTGLNTFYVNSNFHYLEYFIGFENILKQFRLDFVRGSFKGQPSTTGFKLGMNLRMFGRVFDDWP
jgi:hypothetical protein